MDTKTKRLIQALSLSIVFNIVLFAFCTYEWHEAGFAILQEASFRPKKIFSSSLASAPNLQAALEELSQKPLSELVCLLESTQLVYDGYEMRDLSLATLIANHHFHYQKPLSGSLQVKQDRTVMVQGKKLLLFPGLTQEQHEACVRFAKEEKYPFTSEGLFVKLKENPQDDELSQAFCTTGEYLLVETLLSRGSHISSSDVLSILLSGNWKAISQFVEEVKLAQDFSPEKKRKFLLQYLQYSSKKAAELIVQSDKEYALHKLPDEHTTLLLSLLEENPSLCKEYAIELLQSPRKEEVWRQAQKTLAHVCAKEELAKCTRAELLAYFGLKKPQEVAAVKEVKKKIEAPTKPKTSPKKVTKEVEVKRFKKPTRFLNYVVQNGDNLWKISKKFHVAMDAIMFANNMKSDALKPGAVLKIPY